MTPSRRLWSLDLVRLWAAGLVALFHLGWWGHVNPRSSPGRIYQEAAAADEALTFAWLGWVGVEIFFVISGFVIAFSAQNSNAADFLRRRFLRLLPAAFICSTAIAAILFFWGPYSLDDLVQRYLRSISFWPFGPWIDGVFWTLAVEVSFYLCVSLALVFRRIISIEAVAISIGLLSSGLWLTDYILNGQLTGDLIPGLSGRVEQILLLQHGMLFALGALIYASVSGWNASRAILTALFVVSSTLPILEEAFVKIDLFDLEASPMSPVLIWFASIAVIFCASRWEPALPVDTEKQLSVTGQATYPLYLIHDPLGAVLIAGLVGVGVSQLGSLTIALAAAAATSLLISVHLEPALRRFLDPRNIRRWIRVANKT